MFARSTVKKPLTVLVLVIVVLVFGLVSFTRMTPGLFPNVDLPYVAVITSYPGAAPAQVEETVTIPAEGQLASLENIKSTQSVSSRNYSMILLEFENGTDLSAISADIRDRLDMIEDQWDEGVEKPVIMKMNPEMIPVNVSAVACQGKDTDELTDMIEGNVGRELRGTDGVASVSVSGDTGNMIRVQLSEKKIKEANDELKAAMNSALGGSVDMGQLDSAQAQISKGKKQIEKAQKDLNKNSENVSLLLEDIKDKVSEREMAEALGDTQKAALLQMQIDGMKDVLEKMSDQMELIGIDVASIDDSSLSASAALSTFEIYKANSFSTLSNKMSELTAKEAELNGAKNQMAASLSQLGSSTASVDMENIFTVENVSAIISSQNFNMPAGYISDDGRDMMVSVGDKIKSIGELRDLVIFDMGMEGIPAVKLSDVADVSYTSDGETAYSRINGHDGIILTFTQQSDYPTTEVSDNISETFTRLEKEYSGLEFTTLSDQGKYIHIVIDSVLNNLLIGAILAIAILLLFLRNWRPTFITVISMPVSITCALLLMYFSGVSINVISLSGLAVGIGMVVDNSIIVIENIYRLREAGYSKKKAAIEGAVQMTGAITASTLTTICVFAPIVFVEGITREVFMDMALTITYALLASLVIAMTFVPAVAGMLVGRPEKGRSVLGQQSAMLERYRDALAYVLDRKKRFFSGALALLILSTVPLMVKGLDYMPAMAMQEISASITLKSDVKLAKAMETGDEICDQVQDLEGVDTVGMMTSSEATAGIIDTGNKDWSQLSMYVLLDEDAIDKNSVVSKKIKDIATGLGAEDVMVSGDMDISSMSAMGGSGISIELYGEDTDKLRTAALRAEEIMRNTRGVEEVSDTDEETEPQLQVTVNKNKAMRKGFTTAEVYQQVAAALSEGQRSGSMIRDGMERDIMVSSDQREDVTVADLKNLVISKTGQDGETVKARLGSLAEITKERSMASIDHIDQNRVVTVSGSVSEESNVTLTTDEVRERIEKDSAFEGVDVEFGGEREAIADAMGQLTQMMLLGLMLIYLVMVAQFQSFRSPFIIMFTVPLGFTGGFLALLITGQEFSVVSMVGFIVLSGIIVNNGIVLVDQINRCRYEGMEKREAIIQACSTRIRPVLMTALTTVLGLVPMVIGFGTGSEMMQPVAISCIGGLLYATLTTLFIVPAVYEKLGRKKMERFEEDEREMAETPV